MIKDFLVRVLLKRGASMGEELLGKAIRHGFTTYGGVLMAEGYADADDITLLAGAGTAIAGIILSVARKFLEKRI